jgi:HB1/ASXL restriction endonuclease-like protein with HTH domain
LGTFKVAAIKILQKAKNPMHIDDITKLALEQGLIETTGLTPERTMSTGIRRDIRSKGKNSAFVQVNEAAFSLNPSYSEIQQRLDAKVELAQESGAEVERIGSMYIGRAGAVSWLQCYDNVSG